MKDLNLNTDVAIIGGGPAGITASIYVSRQGKKATIFEKDLVGGQMNLSPYIENYPGSEPISGAELSASMQEQAENLGVEFVYSEVTSIKKNKSIFEIECSSGDSNIKTSNVYTSKAVIIATGCDPICPPIFEQYIGDGVSFCSVCDGALYKGKDVAVIGGGNSALTEALELSDICKSVTIVQNLSKFTAQETLINNIKDRANIHTYFGRTVSYCYQEEDSSFTLLLDNDNGIKVDGIFVAVGRKPSTELFKNLFELDYDGYIIMSNVGGVFFAGDCARKKLRQIVTATSDGAIAGVDACNYINLKTERGSKMMSNEVNVGDVIRITYMDGEPAYTDRTGTVTHVDAIGQIHGTWGGCAIVPEFDTFEIVSKCK